ncbi:MAG: hypothetical protein QW101_04070 [Ignisphaera sp.]
MAVSRLYRVLTKHILTSYEFWFFSIFFTLFWAFMGAYAFSRNLTVDTLREILLNRGVSPDMINNIIDEAWNNVVKGYSGGWFATVVVISFGSTSIGLVHYVYNSTLPLRYLSKFSKITSRRILLELVVGSLVALLISFLILFTVCTAMFSHRFDKLILPENPLGLALASIVYGLLIYLLSMTLGLTAVVLRKPGLITKISYIPFTLSMALSLLSVYVGGEVYHYTPFVSAMSLLFYYSANIKPPYDKPLAYSGSDFTPVEPLHAWIVQVLWITLFTLTSLILLKKQKGIPAEEILAT